MNKTTIISDKALITIPGIREVFERYCTMLTSVERIDLIEDPEHIVMMPIVVKNFRS